ncbi:C45 family peptidase, partial [Thermoflexus sp.]|uniref:C45 family peptidase n=1 Tax=Thermoflexus sp. TaxID=1969742 RepID=UPI002ADD5351
MKEETIRVLWLTGSPRERGRQHGRAAAPWIHRYWAELVAEATVRAARPLSLHELSQWLQERAALALEKAPDLALELEGMAEGAGVPWEAVLGLNFYEEIADLVHERGRPARPVGSRCSAVVLPPDRTATGRMLLAQTWDGADWWGDPWLFLVEEHGIRMAYLADAGTLGGVGVNSAGIGSVHTGVTLRVHPPGLPYTFIARRILRCRSVEEAVQVATEAPSTAGCHYIVSDGVQGVDIEMAGTVSATRPLEGIWATCAHFEAYECVVQQWMPEVPASRHRVERLKAQAAARFGVRPPDLFEILADHVPGPGGATVCRHPDLA